MNTGYTPVQGRGFVRPENQNLQNFAEIIPVISGLIGGSETKKDLKWYSPKCNLNTTRADTCNSAIETTKPRTVGAVTGLLTKPLNEVTIMAGTQHTPRLAHTQTAFVWRFLALSAGESQIIHVTAWTEREARNRCPSGCVAVFAARIRQEVRHVQ